MGEIVVTKEKNCLTFGMRPPCHPERSEGWNEDSMAIHRAESRPGHAAEWKCP